MRNYSDYYGLYEDTIIVGYVIAAFVLLFFMIGLPWNVLVIGIILKRKLFTQPSLMLMFNLAVTNFLACLLIMPFAIVLGILPKGMILTDLDKVCQIGVLLVLLPGVSQYTVALMSVDRVIYLKKPLTYGLTVTPWRMFSAIVIVWILWIVISTPLLFGLGQVGYSPDVSTCSPVVASNNTVHPYINTVIIAFGAMGTITELLGCGCIILHHQEAVAEEAPQSSWA